MMHRIIQTDENLDTAKEPISYSNIELFARKEKSDLLFPPFKYFLKTDFNEEEVNVRIVSKNGIFKEAEADEIVVYPSSMEDEMEFYFISRKGQDEESWNKKDRKKIGEDDSVIH